MTISPEQSQQRVARLRHHLHDQEEPVEALLITSATNRQYLSGFSGSNGALLVTGQEALVLTDSRYRLQVAQESPGFAFHQTSSEHPLSAVLSRLVVQMGIPCLSFEAAHVNVALHQKLANALQEAATEADAPSPDLQATENLVEWLREVKEAEELATLRHAAAITDAAYAAVVPHLRPEHTERQVAWMLEVALREQGGAEGVAFPIVVAAGPDAAMPHAHATDDPLGCNRPIVIDMGARYGGYHADMTRTIVLGEADATFQAVYAVVLHAQEQAMAGIRPGMTGAEADSLARDQIVAAGYGDSFGHSLGHGVGLDIHEPPRLGQSSEHTLRVGQVFSIEPGIYLEGWGGVRIEDLVSLREHGCDQISHASKQCVFPLF